MSDNVSVPPAAPTDRLDSLGLRRSGRVGLVALLLPTTVLQRYVTTWVGRRRRRRRRRSNTTSTTPVVHSTSQHHHCTTSRACPVYYYLLHTFSSLSPPLPSSRPPSWAGRAAFAPSPSSPPSPSALPPVPSSAVHPGRRRRRTETKVCQSRGSVLSAGCSAGGRNRGGGRHGRRRRTARDGRRGRATTAGRAERKVHLHKKGATTVAAAAAAAVAAVVAAAATATTTPTTCEDFLDPLRVPHIDAKGG